MPYVVKTYLPSGCLDPVGAGQEPDAERAVATLEAELPRMMREHGANGDWATSAVLNLRGSGGTVGPLPDGTVIEVEPTTQREEGDRMSLIEREPGTQNYEAWFTEYPSTHRRAGQTVEVVTRAAYERLRHDDYQGAVDIETGVAAGHATYHHAIEVERRPYGDALTEAFEAAIRHAVTRGR
jgi:hypothetical protein